MARYEGKGKPKDYDEFYEQQMLERMEGGKVVRMYKTSRGWQFISTRGSGINRALRQGYVSEADAVACGVPVGPHASNKGHEVEVGASAKDASAAKKKTSSRAKGD